MGKIKDIIKITAKAARMNPNNRKNCFEIFGYDFIIDEEFNVYLLEVNTNPGLEESSPLIKTLVPRMIDDAFKLTIDRMFYRGTEENSPYSVKDYLDSENLWEFVVNY
jgi:acid phosphatase class B